MQWCRLSCSAGPLSSSHAIEQERTEEAVNAFIGKIEKPTDAELAGALGPAKTAWAQLLSELAREFTVTIHEWKCYSPKLGWSLRAKRKSRTIIWLSPCDGRFTVLFILGGKAMKAARQRQWPQRVAKALSEAPKYPEGTGVRLQVKSARDIGDIIKLAAIKVAN